MENLPVPSLFRPASPPRRQRACAPCSKAKAQCNFQPENIARHLCDRCERFGVECVAKTGRGLRRPRLMRDKERSAVGNEEQDPNAIIVDNPPKSQTPASIGADESPPYGLTWKQTSHILDLFRKHYVHHFPFALMGPAVTPQQLFTGKPFLFRAIMLVAAPLPESKISEIKLDVLGYLGQHMLVGEEQKLDLLQGLLVVIAWAHTCQIRDEQVTNLTYLALGHAHSLGITRIPASLAQHLVERSPEDVLERARTKSQDTHSDEEQRTLLGVFCILSANSTLHLRRQPFDSPYINHCCAALTSNPSPSNLVLERTVRLTQLSNKLSHAFGEVHERNGGRPHAFLFEGSGRSFRTELTAAVEIAMHPDIEAHHAYFRLWGNYLLVRLYEPATWVHELDGKGIGPSMYRSLCLRNCLNAVKAHVDVLAGLEAGDMVRASVITREQMGFVMLVAVRLLFTESVDWDVKIARAYLDLGAVLDGVVGRIEEADALRRRAVEDFGGGILEEGGWVDEMVRKMRLLKEGFETRLEGRVEEPEEREGMEENVQGLWSREPGIMVWGFPNV